MTTPARNVVELLSSTKHGTGMRTTLKNLGFWVEDGSLVSERKPLRKPPNDPGGLSDEMAYWQAELGRVLDVLSILEAQVPLTRDALKRARNAAMITVKTAAAEADEKLPAKYLVEAQVAEDTTVIELETAEANLASLIVLFKGQLEKLSGHVGSISRQMSLAQALVQRGI